MSQQSGLLSLPFFLNASKWIFKIFLLPSVSGFGTRIWTSSLPGRNNAGSKSSRIFPVSAPSHPFHSLNRYLNISFVSFYADQCLRFYIRVTWKQSPLDPWAEISWPWIGATTYLGLLSLTKIRAFLSMLRRIISTKRTLCRLQTPWLCQFSRERIALGHDLWSTYERHFHLILGEVGSLLFHFSGFPPGIDVRHTTADCWGSGRFEWCDASSPQD